MLQSVRDRDGECPVQIVKEHSVSWSRRDSSVSSPALMIDTV